MCCFQYYLVTDLEDSLTWLPPIFPHCGTGREAVEGRFVLDPELPLGASSSATVPDAMPSLTAGAKIA
jgi:hypothetical protein